MKKNDILQKILKDIPPALQRQVELWSQVVNKIYDYLETENKTVEEFCKMFIYKPEDVKKFFEIAYNFKLEEIVEIESIIGKDIF